MFLKSEWSPIAVLLKTSAVDYDRRDTECSSIQLPHEIACINPNRYSTIKQNLPFPIFPPSPFIVPLFIQSL